MPQQQMPTYPCLADDELADNSGTEQFARHIIDGAVSGEDMVAAVSAALLSATRVGVMQGKIVWITGAASEILIITLTQETTVEIHECQTTGKTADRILGYCTRRLLVDEPIPSLIRAHVLAARWAIEHGTVNTMDGDGKCDPYLESFVAEVANEE